MRGLLAACLVLASCKYDPIRATAETGGNGGSESVLPEGGSPGNGGGGVSEAGSGSGGSPSFARVVQPLFENAPNWNDHVVDEDPLDSVTGADLPRSAPACSRSTPVASAGTCVHAGVMRKLSLPDVQSCQGLTAADERGFLTWTCDDRDGHVVFEARALAPGVGLRDLIDFASPVFFGNTVAVHNDGSLIVRTMPQAFWGNPVIILGEGAPAREAYRIDVKGGIYAMPAELADDLYVVADNVSLIALPQAANDAGPAVVKSLVSRQEPILKASGIAFLWMEDVTFDASNRGAGIDVNLTFGNVRRIAVTRSTGWPAPGTEIQIGASGTTIDGIRSDGAPGNAVKIDAVHSVVRDVKVEGAGATGVQLGGKEASFDEIHVERALLTGVRVTAERSRVARVRVANSGLDGVHLAASRGVTLFDVVTTNNEKAGLDVSPSAIDPGDSRENTVIDVVSSNNGGEGVTLSGSNLRLVRVISAGNENEGIAIYGDANLVMHATAVNNAGAGVLVRPNTVRTSLVNVVSFTNKYGVHLAEGAKETHLHDLVATQNAGDLVIEGNDNVFSGMAKFWNADSCDVPSTVNPGITASPPCSMIGDSSATYTLATDLSDAFVGSLRDGDEINGSRGSLGADGRLARSLIKDWLGFQSRERHWGKNVDASFPHIYFRGRCPESEFGCVIWDWRVTRTSPLRERLAASTPEDPVHQQRHEWQVDDVGECGQIPGATWRSGGCSTLFLAYAFEPAEGSAKGNGNGLCEPSELCVLNRHLGGYPGEGPLEPMTEAEIEIVGFGPVALQRYRTSGP